MEAIVAGLFETKDEAKSWELSPFTVALDEQSGGNITKHLEK
jgi:hypothetical protein